MGKLAPHLGAVLTAVGFRSGASQQLSIASVCAPKPPAEPSTKHDVRPAANLMLNAAACCCLRNETRSDRSSAPRPKPRGGPRRRSRPARADRTSRPRRASRLGLGGARRLRRRQGGPAGHDWQSDCPPTPTGHGPRIGGQCQCSLSSISRVVSDSISHLDSGSLISDTLQSLAALLNDPPHYVTALDYYVLLWSILVLRNPLHLSRAGCR